MKKKEKLVEIYSKANYEADKKKFEDSLKENTPIDWNSFKRLIINDLCLNNIIESQSIGHIKIEDIKHALNSPSRNWKLILAISEKLMRISPYYYRLNMHFANMAVFCWGLDLYDVKNNVNLNTLKDDYFKLASKLEKMNLKHEFSKITKILPSQDIYCGVIVENSNDFFIQQIDYKICKLYQVEDGMYNFAINLAGIKGNNLNAYPKYIRQAYIDFYDGNIGQWYTPSADKQICIKLNTQWTYPIPIMISLIADILDLDIYKKLQLQSARTDNYKAIMIRVPIDKNHFDKPLLSPETLSVFAEINKQNMPDDVGLVHTLGENAEAINFKDSSNTRNNVTDAVDNLYNSSGVSKELFNGSSSGTAVTYSLEDDSGFVYGVYRQLERWVNRYIKRKKYNKLTYKFTYYIMDATIYNRDTICKRYKDAISLGATVIDKWMALLDMTPSRIMGSYITHSAIFDFHNKFIPLNSTYNSSSNEAGRPTNEEKGEMLSDSGESTKDNDSNLKR